MPRHIRVDLISRRTFAHSLVSFASAACCNRVKWFRTHHQAICTLTSRNSPRIENAATCTPYQGARTVWNAAMCAHLASVRLSVPPRFLGNTAAGMIGRRSPSTGTSTGTGPGPDAGGGSSSSTSYETSDPAAGELAVSEPCSASVGEPAGPFWRGMFARNGRTFPSPFTVSSASPFTAASAGPFTFLPLLFMNPPGLAFMGWSLGVFIRRSPSRSPNGSATSTGREWVARCGGRPRRPCLCRERSRSRCGPMPG